MKTTTKQILRWLNAARIEWFTRRGRTVKVKPVDDRYIAINFGLTRSERKRCEKLVTQLERKLKKAAPGSIIAKRLELALKKAKAAYVASVANEPYRVETPTGQSRREFRRAAYLAKKENRANYREAKRNGWVVADIVFDLRRAS